MKAFHKFDNLNIPEEYYKTYEEYCDHNDSIISYYEIDRAFDSISNSVNWYFSIKKLI